MWTCRVEIGAPGSGGPNPGTPIKYRECWKGKKCNRPGAAWALCKTLCKFKSVDLDSHENC